MNISRIMGGILLSLFLVYCSWGTEVINLSPSTAQLKGAVLVDNEKALYIADFNRKEKKISWNIDVPKSGDYIVDLVFRCKQGNGNLPLEFKSGKSVLAWSTFETNDRGKRKHIGKMNLIKGEQTFSITPLQDKEMEFVSARLISSPGFIVSPSEDGSFDLSADKADVSQIIAYEEGLLCGLMYGNPTGWNLKVPEGGKYTVIMEYACPGSGTMNIVLPSGSTQMIMPASGSWTETIKKETGSITLAPGEYVLKLTRGEGAADIAGIKLRKDTESEKELEQLKKKERLGMSRKQLELIWGNGRFCQTPPPIDRRGGKEDLDWELYKGVPALTKCYEWNKPGMKIIASFIQDRCVALTLNIEEKSLKTMKEITEILMPGVKFKWNPAHTTYYSENNHYKVQFWGSYFEIKDSDTLRTLKEKGQLSAKAAKGSSRLGLSLVELKKILGTGGHPRPESSIHRRGEKGDRDWALYNMIKPVTTAYIWEYPEDDYHVTAVFLKDKCIAFDISRISRFNTEQLLEKAAEFVPGAVFDTLPASGDFTVYSTNFDKGYKLQGWEFRQNTYTYLEIKASGLINRILEEHEEELKKAVIKTLAVLRNSSEQKKIPLLGSTRADIDAYLGISSMESPVEYNGKPTCVWKLPESDLELYGSFIKTSKGFLCAQITIVDAIRQLKRYIALPVAAQIVSPVVMEKIEKEDANLWRTVKSKDRDGRFQFEWYEDKNGGPALRITDTLVLKQMYNKPAEQKKEEQKPEKSPTDFRKIL